MRRHEFGMSRRELREGAGREVDREHFEEVLGSSEFYIYIPPTGKMKGYPELKAFLEAEGCRVEYPGYSDLNPSSNYSVVAISRNGQAISEAALLKAHRWAHKRNFLHSFFRPL